MFSDSNWMTWLNQVFAECKLPDQFGLRELKAAWESGQTPTQVALSNDALAVEYRALNCTK